MKTFLKLYHPISRWNHVRTSQRWRWKYNWRIQYGLLHCGAIYSTHYWIWNSHFTSITKNFQKFFEIHRLTASFSKKSRQRTQRRYTKKFQNKLLFVIPRSTEYTVYLEYWIYCPNCILSSPWWCKYSYRLKCRFSN